MPANSPSSNAQPPPPVRRHLYTWLIPLITVVLVIAAVVGGLYLQATRFPGEEGLPVADDVEGGAELYARYCATCHGDRGQGTAMFPPVVNTDWVVGDKDRLILVTLHGLTGPIEVRGELYDFDYGMPAFEDRLSDEQLASVLTHIRTSWGNEASPITSEEVAALRQEYEGRTTPWRDEEL